MRTGHLTTAKYPLTKRDELQIRYNNWEGVSYEDTPTTLYDGCVDGFEEFLQKAYVKGSQNSDNLAKALASENAELGARCDGYKEALKAKQEFVYRIPQEPVNYGGYLFTACVSLALGWLITHYFQ